MYSLPVVNACNFLDQIFSTKSMYKILVARAKLSNLISKFKFINTNQMSIHLFPVMHLYALHLLGYGQSNKMRICYGSLQCVQY